VRKGDLFVLLEKPESELLKARGEVETGAMRAEKKKSLAPLERVDAGDE